ncbi:MAG TPA: glycosyltransferase family A protein [Chthonomonadaceae bacterium]|nr:glycosyltransferase family A protein [Chthonomonadaceae bacterium]
MNAGSRSETPISVLVATRERPEDLFVCLRSLLAQDYGSYEIVVLDQSPSEATEQAVRQAFGTPQRLRFLRSNTMGKSLAMNRLIEAACGTLLACTDDDTEVPPDWLTRIEAAFRQNPEEDILFGQVEASEAALAISDSRTPVISFPERRCVPLGEVAGMGANMAMRREVGTRVGGFDALLGPGAPFCAAEEGDFVYRAQLGGARVFLEPSVTLVHRAWRTLEAWGCILYGYGIGDAAFALKHVRCGDGRMARLLAGRPAYMLARLCYRILRRRFHEEEHYLRGYAQGIRRSLRYRVDRRTRLYQPQPGP